MLSIIWSFIVIKFLTYSFFSHAHTHTLTTFTHTHRAGLGLQSLGHRVNTSQLPKQLRRRQETQYLPHDYQSDVPHTETGCLSLTLWLCPQILLNWTNSVQLYCFEVTIPYVGWTDWFVEVVWVKIIFFSNQNSF